MEAKLLSTIELRENRSGQPRAFIAGTRVRVQDVHVLAEIQGLTPEQIVAALPHLTLGQVHAALSYFWDHQSEILRELAEDEAFIEAVRRRLGPGPLARKLNRPDAGPD